MTESLKGSGLAYRMVSLMDSVKLSVRDRFLLRCSWLESLCLRRAGQTHASHSLLPSVVLRVNSLATSPPFSFTMTGNRSLRKSHTEFALTPFSRPHEKAVKITHCSLRWLSQHKELIDRTLSKLHGALFWSRTYVHIDYCVYDSQGLQDTNAQCLTF